MSRLNIGDEDTSSMLVTSAIDDLSERTPAERVDTERDSEAVVAFDGATSGRGEPMNELPQARSRGGLGGGFRRNMCGVDGALTELKVLLSSNSNDDPLDEMPDSPSDELLLRVSSPLRSGVVATNGVEALSGRSVDTSRLSGTAAL